MIIGLRVQGSSPKPDSSTPRKRSGIVRQVCPRSLLAVCTAFCLSTSGENVASQTPTPAKPAVATPAPAQGQADAAIRDALQQYSAALESLDADQVKKIHPTVDAEGLRRALRDMRELKVTIDNVKVLSIEGPIARVSCRVTQTFTPKSGARNSGAVNRVLRLRRQEAAWLIDGFER
jgi:hypothetical protein